MMNIPLRVLIAEDSESDTELIMRILRRGGFDIAYRRVESSGEMRDALSRQEWDIVLSDYAMPQFDAPSALAILKETGCDIPFIVISGNIGESTAVEMMKEGAHDYLMKDNLPRLLPAVERELREAEIRRERKRSEAERRLLEDQLRQAQKMEAVGQLAGGVAHDFNNLLYVITGYGELVMEQLPVGKPVHNHMKEIMKAAQRAATLVRQLLLFSRREAMQMKTFDPNELIADLMKMLRRIIGEHIILEVKPGFGLKKIHADPGQIEQVLTNICVNARDAMPDGGSIVIETENVSFDAEYRESNTWAKQSEYLLLTVSDTGSGIPYEIRDRVFEPFFTTKEVGKGTGLGLAAVYGIVRSHQGMIRLHGEPGQGTIFEIYLPVAETIPNSAGDEKETPKPLESGKETILVAEDEESVRNMMVHILGKVGYRVFSAKDGEEAISIFERHSAGTDLALLDIIMPKAGGDKVLERIRAIRPDMPVIFITGYGKDNPKSDVPAEQRCEVLRKPVSSTVLLRKIREVLDA